MQSKILITKDNFDIAEQYQLLRSASPQSGAIVFFVGLVREFYQSTADDESIDYIELTHYSGMTEKLCEQIIQQAGERFDLQCVRLIHRVGRLSAHQQIVMVAVASAHRQQAFAAAQFIMDYLKTQAPFWKKEVGSRGQQWLGIKQQDKIATQQWQNKQNDDKN